MRGDLDLRSARRIRLLVRTWHPDVVHAHDARSHAIALLALAGNQTPLVVTRRVTFPLKAVRLKYGRRVSRFIAVSRAVRSSMMQSGVDGSRIDVVHSGVPIPGPTKVRDWRQELGWPSDSVVAGVVGAMTSEKGVAALEEISARLSPSVAARTRLLLLGGTGRGATSIGKVRTFDAGFITDIYDAMAGLDVLWHPARDEGLGTAIIDSMALGVPPIAFAVGGIPELITDGESGRLISAGDASGFAAAHEELLDEDVRMRIGHGGRAAAKHFSVGAMTDGTERVYQRVLNI